MGHVGGRCFIHVKIEIGCKVDYGRMSSKMSLC